MLKTERKIEAELRRLEKYLYRKVTPLDGWEYRKALYPAPQQYKMLSDWAALPKGLHIGEPDTTFFLRNQVQIPLEFHGEEVALFLDIGGESEIFVDGIPFSGLDHNHTMIRLLPCAKGGETLSIEIECHSKNLVLNTSDVYSEDVCIRRSELAVICPEIRNFYYTTKTLYEYIAGCPEEYTRIRVMRAVYDSLLFLDFRDPDLLSESSIKAQETLQQMLKPLERLKMPLTLYLAGHSHIDVAWLWPLKETVRKTGRTFSSMLRLMEQYPQFRFSQSMPALYEMAEKNYPAVFSQIQQRVKEGRWETLGPMYLEPDCNLISGESFIRQIIYGKKYYKTAFGTDSRVCFLPDVFGFSPAMPQILKKSGVDYFLTTKLTWNETNQFPYSIFRWRGLDGTEVIAGMLTMCTVRGRDLYNGDLSPSGLRQTLECFQNKEGGQPDLYLYGHGDGGGGVTMEMLEAATRLSDVPLLPEIRFGGVEEYFDNIEGRDNLPVWSGELYFEKHRGTYTTAAKNKRNNRMSEFLYRDAELFSCLCRIQSGAFTSVSLEEGWKLILLNQFHDILPGTSIAPVYEQSDVQYNKIREIGEKSISASLSDLLTPDENAITVFNTLSWERSEFVQVTVPVGKCIRCLDKTFPPQVRLNEFEILFRAESIPAMGYRVYETVPETELPEFASNASVTQSEKDLYIETETLQVRIDENGELTQLFDKVNNRNVLLSDAKGNQLRLLEDIPVEWGAAWETCQKREDRPPIPFDNSCCRLKESNNLYTTVEVTRHVSGSTIRQLIRISHYEPMVAFDTVVDWNEHQKILRVAFPVSVSALNATYDVAFGNIQRPTHTTHSVEEAQFEVCGHKWGDLSDAGWGVTLFNDCKYGYTIRDQVMELSLLRSADYPSTSCDRGTHSFTYWIYPHQGTVREAGVARKGYEVNVPLHAVSGRIGSDPCRSFLNIESRDVIIDTVKPSEDGKALIVRIYETSNTSQQCALHLGFSAKRILETDLMEVPLAAQQVSQDMNGTIHLYIHPYEVKTYRIEM